jgi:hypothetical protein
MRNLLAIGFSVFAAPLWAAGLPQLPALGGAMPSAPAPAATSLPLAPVVLDLGLSTPGFGGPVFLRLDFSASTKQYKK